MAGAFPEGSLCSPSTAAYCVLGGSYSVNIIDYSGSITGGYLNSSGDGVFNTNGGYVGQGTITDATVSSNSITATVSIDGYSGTGTFTGSAPYYSGSVPVYHTVIGEVYLTINNLFLVPN